MMNWKGFGRKWSRPNSDNVLAFAWRDRETTNYIIYMVVCMNV
jgi:hypothetical protein